jgi:hypothetical protein
MMMIRGNKRKDLEAVVFAHYGNWGPLKMRITRQGSINLLVERVAGASHLGKRWIFAGWLTDDGQLSVD